MLPLFDEMPTRRLPIITLTLIVVNFLVLIFMLGLEINDRDKANQFVYKYSMVPWEVTNGKHVDYEELLSADSQPPPPDSPDSDPYGKNIYLSLLTHMFLHGGILHLLGNMWFLWFFGTNVEEVFGGLPFLLFYLFCGVIAALSQWAAYSGEVVAMVGASGAISGVMGAYLVIYPRQKVFSIIFFWPAWVPAWALIIAWFAYQALFGLISQVSVASGGTAWFAHIGGLISGTLVTLLLYPWLRRRRDALAEVYVPVYPSYMKKGSQGS
jgi:membrane associated rhomboid family serine protease